MKPAPSGSGSKNKRPYYLAEAMQFAVSYIKALNTAKGNLPNVPMWWIHEFILDLGFIYHSFAVIHEFILDLGLIYLSFVVIHEFILHLGFIHLSLVVVSDNKRKWWYLLCFTTRPRHNLVPKPGKHWPLDSSGSAIKWRQSLVTQEEWYVGVITETWKRRPTLLRRTVPQEGWCSKQVSTRD